MILPRMLSKNNEVIVDQDTILLYLSVHCQ